MKLHAQLVTCAGLLSVASCAQYDPAQEYVLNPALGKDPVFCRRLERYFKQNTVYDAWFVRSENGCGIGGATVKVELRKPPETATSPVLLNEETCAQIRTSKVCYAVAPEHRVLGGGPFCRWQLDHCIYDPNEELPSPPSIHIVDSNKQGAH